jgi:hypothetical protein
MKWTAKHLLLPMLVGTIALGGPAELSPPPRAWAQELNLPPQLPDGRSVVTITSAKLLDPQGQLRPGVTVAQVPPRVVFPLLPGPGSSRSAVVELGR